MVPGDLRYEGACTTRNHLYRSLRSNRSKLKSSFRLFFRRRQHHYQLAAFHLWKLFHYPIQLKISLDPLQQAETELLVCHLASAKTQGNFRLIAFLQKLDQVTQLDLVIAFVRAWTKFYFLDLYLLLLELGIMRAFGFLILEFAKIHQAANWRLRHRRNFYQVHARFFGYFECPANRHYTYLFSIYSNQTYLGGGDFVVDALRLFLGDGSILL